MAWHIFRKDLVLLWPLVLFGVLAQWGLFALVFAMDASPQSPYLRPFAQLGTAVVFLAIVFTAALAAQQEPIPGTRQDWLVRPIRRWDLLLAKLLFVVLAVHLPMFLGDLVGTMAHGFPLGDAVGAALARDGLVFVTVSLPALAFAAMTRTLGQFIAAGIAYVIATVAIVILLSLAARIAGQEQATNPLAWTGVAWIPQTVSRIVLAAGAVIALLLLYLRRRVTVAWAVFPAFLLLSALFVLLPWDWIFALQQTAAAASAAPPVALAFDPAAPRYRPAPGENADAYAAGAGQVQLRGRAAGDVPAETRARGARGDVTVYIPLRISGLPTGALPWADRAAIRLTDPAGQLVFEGRGDDLKMSAGGLAYEALRLPALVYERAKDRPLSLQVDVSLTVLAPRPTLTIAALGADARLHGIGRCTSGRDSDGDEIELRCVTPANPPSCLAAALADPATGRRNPDVLICAPNYTPYATRSFPDVLSRFEIEAPFRDRFDLGTYPVGADRLAEARVVLTRYEAQAHLVKRATAGGVRLADWTATAPGKSLRP
ncbi:MAG: hypothetical protein ACXU82_05615 [Caulobacteraceae bacterium]